ncbi:TrkH family potassium uptake protein [Streptococcus sp. E17BB]|uniref:TrkH family potassium uptake protein n=1 Tax=Streptococcus sp. E17BB TaxID=3278714 RepID=UPI00359D64BA
MMPELRPLTIAQKLSISFLATILVGSLLLSLPIFHVAGAPPTSYLDHLFHAVSMVCVTGLSVFPVAEVYNRLGQVICLILIQIGGLGLVSLIAISYYTLKRKVGVNDQELLKSSLSFDQPTSLKEHLFSIYKITLTIEGVGALLLMVDFIPRYGWADGIFNSIFLAISAFCNAGFDNLGANSLGDFVVNPLVNLVIAGLILSGGLGFIVWKDLIQAFKRSVLTKPRQPKRLERWLSPHSKLMLITTGIILLAGTLLSWLIELDNPATIGHYSPPQQLLVSFFQTVTMRTAGFSTISYVQTDLVTNILYILQMLMGGAPGGTAGGLKLSVVAILFLLFKAELSGNSQILFQYRSIPQKLLKQTLTVLIFFFTVFLVGYLLLLQVEPSLDPFALLFEVASALATVGITMDVTSQLGLGGRVIIMLLMFIGRVGPITVLLSLVQKKEKPIQYAETNILVG